MSTIPAPSREVFASAAKPDEIQAFPDWARGWGITFDPGQTEGIPPMEWMNNVFNKLNEASAYLLQHGIAPHVGTETYPKDACCTYDGTVWIAKRANTNVVPGTSRDDWNVASGSSRPMFSVEWWCGKRSAIPAGAVPADGQLLSAALYPDAAKNVYLGNAKSSVVVATDADWLSNTAFRGIYSMGDNSTTFRAPDYNGKHADSLGAVFMRGDGKNAHTSGAGHIQGDAIRNITGTVTEAMTGGNSISSGAIDFTQSTQSGLTGGPTVTKWGAMSIDASRVVPTSVENRPVAVTGCWIIWLFGDVTNAGSADAAALATAYANLAGSKLNISAAFGVGQILKPVTRTVGITYTNTTGKLILLFGNFRSGLASIIVNIEVDGTLHELASASAGTGPCRCNGIIAIPPGKTYKILVETNVTERYYTELTT